MLLTGGLLLASNIMHWGADLWSIAWPSALLVFGLFGLVPKFSFFRLGCGIFGGYFLLTNLTPNVITFDKTYLLPIVLLLFGLSLLVDALKKKNKKGRFQVFRNGQRVYSRDGKQTTRNYTVNGESFNCSVSFGSDHQYIQLPRLARGSAEVSFGELEIDLCGCGEFAENCAIDADCSFGELTICVPRHCRVEPASGTAFGSVDIFGSPNSDAVTVIHMNCSANFGDIRIRYI